MEKLEVILIILSAAFLLFVLFSIPFLLQIWRTAKSMETTLRTFNQNLPGIMKNLEEITTNVNLTTTTVHRRVEELSLTAGKIQGTLNLVVGMEEILRRGTQLHFAKKLRTATAIAKGIRVFLEFLLTERPPRRGNPAGGS